MSLLAVLVASACVLVASTAPSVSVVTPASEAAAPPTQVVDPQVIILGAGAAGIAAAAALTEVGITDFLVLEHGAHIGGRLRAEAFGDSVIELGANWIEGGGLTEKNEIYALSQHIKLRGDVTRSIGDKGAFAMYPASAADAHAHDDDALAAAFVQARVRVFEMACDHSKSPTEAAALADLSVRDALTQVGWPSRADQTRAHTVVEYFGIAFDWGAPAEKISVAQVPCGAAVFLSLQFLSLFLYHPRSLSRCLSPLSAQF